MADEHDLGHSNANSSVKHLLIQFLKSRRLGIAPCTIQYYRQCLTPFIRNHELTSDGINKFLANLNCNGAGKLAYLRAIRAFATGWIRMITSKKAP